MSKLLAVRASVVLVVAAFLVAALPALAQTGNNAEVVWEETWLPASLACGQRVTVRVTMRNVGTTVWTKDVYKLGPVDDSDELNGPGRIHIESDEINDVPPGEKFTFEFELEAPGNNSVRWTDWQMVHEGVEWFGEIVGQQVEVSCAVPVDDAQVVGFDLPGSVECGQIYQASVTMRNTGTTTWNEGGLYRLGPVGDQDDLSGPGRVLLGAAEVPPGGVHTFHFELRAPEQPAQGLVTDWRMVHDNVAWFGGIAAQTVVVACTPPTDDAQVVAVNLPTALECGQAYQASVTMKNTGTTTWSEAGLYRLGAAGDQDDLNGPGRVLMGGEQVPPGGQYTFNFELRAPEQPAQGLVTDWRMVHDDVAWFGEAAASAVNVACQQPTDDAVVVAADLPSWLMCGEPYLASVTVRNTGTTTWTAGQYTLGAVDESDDLGGPVRVHLPASASVPPGGEYTFSFELRAPGPREEPALTDWRMVHEGVAWFGQVADRVVVVECDPDPPVTFPVRAGLWPGSEEESSADDIDGDGIPQARELELASAFFPTIWMDVEERCPGPGGSVVRPGTPSTGRLVFRVRPHPADASRIAISYALLYARDCGDGVVPFDDHHGDVEPFAITLEPNSTCPTGYAARSIKTWAHEGTIGEAINTRSLGGRCVFGASYNPVSKFDMVVVSEDKHGNYLSLSSCDGGAGGTDHCSFGFTMGDENAWVGYNAGEPDAPRHHDLAPLGFPGERMWSGLNFCGGFPHQGKCPDPVENKMADQFVAPLVVLGQQTCQELGGTCSATETCPADNTSIGGAIDCEVCCAAPEDSAEIVSFDLPVTLACGQTYQASVTVHNTGTATWTEEGLYRLGSVDDHDDLNGPGRVLLAGEQVPPDGDHTFRFELRAPDQPGQSLVTDWRMVHDNVAWFGEAAASAVNVSCQQPVDDAQVVTVDLPSALECGQTYEASVTVRNTGTTTWSEESLYRLGPVGDQDDLGGPARVLLPTGVTVEPGGEHTFSFTLTAPYKGGAALTDWQMVRDNVAWFGAQAASTLTITCGCPAGRCDAGCALVPAFTASATQIGVAMPVTFSVANPDAILDESPNWDFGDGEHCEHCSRTVTHSYARPGTYAARLTATESRCGQTLVSEPVAVSVFDRAVPRNDAAEVVAYDLPAELCTGTYQARVTMRNIGNTPWVPGEYSLGAVMDRDPFTDFVRVALDRAVQPEETHTFSFTMRPSADGCPLECVTDWQMIREGVAWFGGVASGIVRNRSCGNPGPSDYACRASVTDEFGQPQIGKQVVIKAYVFDGERFQLVAESFGATDSVGRAVISIPIAQEVHMLECEVAIGTEGDVYTTSIENRSGLPAGSVVTADAIAVPEPTYSFDMLGTKSPSAAAHLYQAGAYDKVIVIPEPLNPNELVAGPRTRESFFAEARRFLVPFHQLGFDVWVANAGLTGRNIHEQAAELGQLLQYATRGYPQEFGSGPGYNGKAALIGISLGGVVSRVATARWESADPGDAAWRSQLGLEGELPVSLIIFVDSPLAGANISMELQSFLWAAFDVSFRSPEKINMNSCAFQQLAQVSRVGEYGCRLSSPDWTDKTCNWQSFYERGTEVRFPGRGTCDLTVDGRCICEPGPAVFTINGDGFAHGPHTIAYSDGMPTEPNQCYGDDRDITRDGKGLCGSKPQARIIQLGEEFMQLDINNCPDAHLNVDAADLQPGSRLPSLDGERYSLPSFLVCDEINIRQFSSPTFIPASSAHGQVNGTGCAVKQCLSNEFNGAHVNPTDKTLQQFAAAIFAASGAPMMDEKPFFAITGSRSVNAGEQLLFRIDGATPDQTYIWTLGDGTVRSGPAIAHRYGSPGRYGVSVAALAADGSATRVHTEARVEIPNNVAPEVGVSEAQMAQVGVPVVLYGSARDADGRIVRTFWNFGDGEFGDGLTTAHAYAEPGTYTVTFSATDDEGAWTAAETVVAVGTPPAPVPLAPIGAVPAGVVTLSWSAVQQATGYRVVVLDAFNATVFTADVPATGACAATSCSVQTTSALAEGEYAWLVLGRNDAGEGPLSTATHFVVVPAVNHPPSVSIEVTSTCSNICTVTFTAIASDLDGDVLSFVWSGCSSGTGSSVTCQTRPAGDHAAAVAVTDSRGASATASRTVTAYVSSWATGTWSECKGAGEFTCTASGANGCARPGTQLRSVKPIAQTLDPNRAAPQPPSTQPCTETTSGFVASWAAGPWSACSVACGGGIQTRTMTPASFTAIAPGVDQPPTIQSCNTQACGLTCYNYTNMYPSKAECLSKGWAVCEVRYRGDGLGGTLTCWKGFS